MRFSVQHTCSAQLNRQRSNCAACWAYVLLKRRSQTSHALLPFPPQVDLSADKLAVNGRPLSTAAASTLCHFAVHKPVGYTCSTAGQTLQQLRCLASTCATPSPPPTPTQQSQKPCLPPLLLLHLPPQVNLSADKLAVNGRPLSTAAASTLCHFAVHKPVGYICSNVSRQPGMRAIDLLQPYLDSWQQKHKVK